MHLIKAHGWGQVLVFTRMKHGANRLAELAGADISSARWHPRQQEPDGAHPALAEFKAATWVLVATDIAARGHRHRPTAARRQLRTAQRAEDYVHRIGRTGRAGTRGEAISLVCVDEQGFLRDIERLIKRQIPREVVPGFEPNPNERPSRSCSAAW